MKEKLQHIFQNSYPGIEQFFADVIEPIFSNEKMTYINKEIIDSPEKRCRAASANIQSARYVADIVRADSDPIAIYDVTLASNSYIEHSRVAIKQFITSNAMTYTHVFIVFHYADASDRPWRFSYVYKERSTAGTRAVAKRYTYVFGRDYRSRTAVERFLALAHSPKADEDFKDAFSVEALGNEFFDEYKKHYIKFVKYISGKVYEKKNGKWQEVVYHDPQPYYSESFCSNDKTVRDYVKKLFGRIVFLYFLQRKGWLNGDRQYMHNLFYNSTEKGNFLDGVLEPLFFGVLNEQPEYRTSEAKKLPGIENIPYLNGGLFAKDELDELNCVFPEEDFKKLFDFLDSYNFTIDENDTEDAEIGIDPEMLGRIFENLLEDNKDKGAFYTPKEIVEYMCRESIIAYLQNEVPERSHELIRNFVENCDASQLTAEQNKYLRKKLQEVKICDPAIGSGAFPMGLVNLLSRLYIAMKADTDTSKMKRHIMENNIYGVDLDKGAVDIARLRFWLAMIVEAREPVPLPNLHFKIMQGNSLLESYQGEDLGDMTKVKALKGLELSEKSKGKLVDLGLFDTINAERDYLKNALAKYYNASNHAERDRLFNEIINNVRRQLFDKGITLPQGMDPSANEEFFLWHTWFHDVFSRPSKEGFDIVIGNPPYIQLQNSLGKTARDKHGREYDMKLGDLYKDAKFETFEKTGDIYCLFYERGWQLLRKGGHLCFITSNKWMRAGYGEKIRKFLAGRTNPMLLIDFGGVRVFESATVDTNILLFSKSGNRHTTVCAVANKQKKDSVKKNLSEFVRQNAVGTDFATSDSWVILSPIEREIKRKIEAVGTPLKDWDIQIYRGVLTGCNEAFIISSEKREEILANCLTEEERQRTDALIRPILRGRDIKRYGYDWAGLWLIATFPSRHYDIEQYPAVKEYLLSFGIERLEQTGKEYVVDGQKVKARKKTNNKWFETQDSISYWEDFSKPKIMYPNMTKFLPFYYDEKGFYQNDKSFMITGKNIEFLTAFLNSSLFKWAYIDNFPELQGGTRELRKIFFDKIPVINVDDSINDEFSNLLAKMQTNPTRELAEYIDQRLFTLYNLTEEEKHVIGFIEIQ